MKLHVVLLNEGQSEETLLSRTRPANLVGLGPVIRFCYAGKFPGVAEKVYCLDDVAWKLCQGLNLNVLRVVDSTELPEGHGTLIG